uniref:Uncharacterized protein n=1 Tax=Romanomermis culicivorax TaxID=13658 RepID=A0A915KDP3_ROMCU
MIAVLCTNRSPLYVPINFSSTSVGFSSTFIFKDCAVCFTIGGQTWKLVRLRHLSSCRFIGLTTAISPTSIEKHGFSMKVVEWRSTKVAGKKSVLLLPHLDNNQRKNGHKMTVLVVRERVENQKSVNTRCCPGGQRAIRQMRPQTTVIAVVDVDAGRRFSATIAVAAFTSPSGTAATDADAGAYSHGRKFVESSFGHFFVEL